MEKSVADVNRSVASARERAIAEHGRESLEPGEKSGRMLLEYRGEHPQFRTAAFRPGSRDGVRDEIDGIVGPLGGG